METYLIAGLGNPDKKYEETRHNAGFKSLDKLAEKLHVSVTDKKFKGLFGSTVSEGRKLMLLKPQTYMNLSGESVAAAAHFYNIPEDHIIVLFDDINFSCGRPLCQFETSGSSLKLLNVTPFCVLILYADFAKLIFKEVEFSSLLIFARLVIVYVLFKF